MSQKSGMGFIYIMFILFVGLFTVVLLVDGGDEERSQYDPGGKGAIESVVDNIVGTTPYDVVVCNGKVENPQLGATRIADSITCKVERFACERNSLEVQFPWVLIPAVLLYDEFVGGVDQGYIQAEIDGEKSDPSIYKVKEMIRASGKGEPWETSICVVKNKTNYDVNLTNYGASITDDSIFIDTVTVTAGIR